MYHPHICQPFCIVNQFTTFMLLLDQLVSPKRYMKEIVRAFKCLRRGINQNFINAWVDLFRKYDQQR